MTAPLTTSITLNPVAPATPAAAASTAETPAGFEFQPVLAALTQTPPSAAPAALPALVAAAAAAPAGKSLPAGGESLPLTDEVQLEGGETAPLPLVGELTTPVPDVVDSDDASGDAIDPDLTSLVANDFTADLPATAPSAPPPTSLGTSPEMGEAAAPAVTELPVAATVVTSTLATAATPTPNGSMAPTPAVTPPVSGAVKRLLPESTTKTPVAVQATADAQPSPSTTGAADDGAPAFDLSALMQAAEGDLGASEPAPSTAGPTANPAALARENPLRAYQTTAPTTAQVDVPVGRQGFSEAVLEKVMWFSAQQIGSAEIHLNPAELGPLSVRISTHQDQASVYFSSHHAAVRDALDQALPRLREMFDGQGIQLLDAGVGEQRHARQQAGTQGGEGGGGTLSGDEGGALAEGDTVDNGGRSVRVSQRLLDAYA